MLVLALDTATASVVVGVVDVDAPGVSGWFGMGRKATRTVESGNRHAETLGLLIPDVLDEAGAGMSELEAVVVGLGPGPFTGLRVGVMTAAALGDALGIPVYGVCTHDAIALGHNAHAPATTSADAGRAAGLVVVTDARRKECYWADYDSAGARRSGPHVERPADVVTRPDWDLHRLVIGDETFSEALGVSVIETKPDPIGLVLAATDLTKGEPPAPLEPLYLRRPDARPPAARKPVTPR